MKYIARTLMIFICGIVGFVIADGLNFPGLTGFLIGVLGGFFIVLIDVSARRVSIRDLITLIVGLIVGLIIASLVSYGISVAVAYVPALKERQFGLIPIAVSVAIYLIFVYLSIAAALGKKEEILGFKFPTGLKSGASGFQQKILDTSVIIDGRVAEILEIGFLDGEVIIPKFVLHELQMIADSPDAMKRTRGRRGLDILQRMQKASPNVKVFDDNFPELHGVDEKLIKLAKKYNAKIVTNDFNLNKVAEVEKVKVLNLNDLSNAVKPIVLPGEFMRVKILKEGKEANQGVAYLDDGTMIVVDGARQNINSVIDIVITSAIQTSAGRMIFAKKKEE